MSDQPMKATPDPRGKCDHICLNDGEHVERGEGHFYGYENPSPRDLTTQLSAVTAERDAERALREGYQLKLAFTAGDLSFAQAELSELRARVQTARELQKAEDFCMDCTIGLRMLRLLEGE